MESELERIIKETEIVILPEGRSIEEFLMSPRDQSLSYADQLNQISSQYEISYGSDPLSRQVDDESDTVENFEAAYQMSKAKNGSLEIPLPEDFSHLLNDQPSSSLYPFSLEEQAAEKALALNEIFKEKLSTFNSSLLRILVKVNEKFKTNNIYLEIARGDKLDSTHFKRSYSKCGMPFFKDAHGDPCAANEDYRYRKNVLREFFPYDQPETRDKWRTSEKVKLIQGVRQQMVSHIVSQQSIKVCQDTRKTRGKLQKLKFITNNKDLQTASISSLDKTIQESFPDFTINWNIISFSDLDSSHSETECMGIWYSYLNPSINRDPFTDDETVKIINAVDEDTYDTWQDVANLLDNRSALQTYLRYTTIYMKLCPSHVRWTLEEDQLLLDSIAKYSVGPQSSINWNKIGQDFPMRSKTQCYNRYLIIAKYSNSKRGVFSLEEDRVILEYVSKHGEENINKMPTHYIPGRSITQIRNHYNMSLKNIENIKPWTREEDKLLMEFVEKHGFDFAKFANNIKTHTRISCRTRYQTIRKFLDKNPDKTVADVPSRSKTCLKKVDSKDVTNWNDSGFTIIEVQREKKETVRGRSVDKLKKENFELYCMLLPCFNLNFQLKLKVNDTDAMTVMNMMKVNSGDLTSFRKHACSKDQLGIIDRLKKSYVAHTNTANIPENLMIPANFGTAAALRAVYFKTKDCTQTLDDFNVTKDDKFNASLKDFQQRFISLFYWTAIASRLDLEQLKTLNFMRNPLQNTTALEILISKNKGKIKKSSV